MHIKFSQCANFVWRSMIIVDITGFVPVFLCAHCACFVFLQKSKNNRRKTTTIRQLTKNAQSKLDRRKAFPVSN